MAGSQQRLMDSRKNVRLPEYDYSQNGVYFVTVCTRERKHILGSVNVANNANIPNNPVGADIIRPPVTLTETGLLVQECISKINMIYPAVFVDKYVIMPNHIHLLLSIDSSCGRMISAPTLSRVVGQMKRAVSKNAGFGVWQKSFYEHIIRNEQDYLEVWQYIDSNPYKWAKDEYHP